MLRNTHSQRTGCPIACALDIVGDHWMLLIIRDLMFLGRHEYKDMLRAEEGISSNILSDRLKKLECSGLVQSIPHPKSGKRKLYFLTSKGKDMIHVLIDLIRWSDKHLDHLIDIPADKRTMIVEEPELMAKLSLQSLSEWERNYGLPGA